MEEDRPGEGVKALCGLPGQEGEGDDEQEDHERSLQPGREVGGILT